MKANQDLVRDMDNCLINTKLDSSSFFIYILKYARGHHGHCASLEEAVPMAMSEEQKKKRNCG